MFERLTNRYFFGKAGKGDFTPDDLPENRWQLFWDMLKTHLSALVKLNLMQIVVWIPAMIVIYLGIASGLNQILIMDQGDGTSIRSLAIQEQQRLAKADGTAAPAAEDEAAQAQVIPVEQAADNLRGILMMTLLLLVPTFTITGPASAGMSYITRNWARDEHAFLWSDFKDAVKANWKQSLLISFITSLMPLIVYVGWTFYSSLAANQALMMVPQVLVVLIGLVWAISVTYMHPMIVGYKLNLRGVLRNSFLLGVGRLPMSVGIRLLHCVPILIFGVVFLLWNPSIALLAAFAYYLLIGFALSRFVTASYTNAAFDRYINSRIEGAKINRGLREPDEDDGAEDQPAGEDGDA